MTSSTEMARATRSTARLPGPDVVRAVALIGVVVMNYHGYLILRADASSRAGWAEELFDPWHGPLSTRFAATFVLVAGVGVALMTTRAVQAHRAAATVEESTNTGRRIRTLRQRLARRGLALYVGGVLLDEIWPGTIIPYYGAMFVIAALVFTWRSRWVALLGAGAAIGGAALRLWRFERERDGASTRWLTHPAEGSWRDHLFGVVVNGTHPLLPWLAFLCAGVVLGRLLPTTRWRPYAIGGGIALTGACWLVSQRSGTALQDIALSVEPLQRGVVYTASALGTALVAYGVIDWLAERHPVGTDPLRRAGQMTLTLYLAHVVVFNLVVDWLGWIEPAGVARALVFAVCFWAVGIIAAGTWQRRHGLGPAERFYRFLGG